MGCVNNREVGDLRRQRAHYDVIVMTWCHQQNIAALSKKNGTCEYKVQTLFVGLSKLFCIKSKDVTVLVWPVIYAIQVLKNMSWLTNKARKI